MSDKTTGRETKQPVRKGRPPARTNDPDRTREDILRIATIAFARDGLNGSRVDEIAELTHTSKRMIYYYFGSKEGLYRAVLERCYEGIRKSEEQMNLAALSAEAALTKLVRSTFDYHVRNEDFVRLVMVENIHQAHYLREIDSVKYRAQYAQESLARILAQGVSEGVFREGLNPLDVHITISALCFYNVSNRYTVAHVFDHDMGEAEHARHRQDVVVESVLALCRRP
ncbi:MAG: TetR family transcriptional regulator [Asticcacaulis sp.]